ncbi:MAG TPA: TetR/AcrR family transcriptional regulator [Baekduia sp.]|uniref:TetR/AcrR family transcriptional regulator n=1 Tax=Baekduia sp. TaxID=2600305 RepID=UPI002D78BFF0|nr:TetR/AcrR family transcriptional regulator [Baekduia sp.]HET6505247.1 TetR/AcrR family transcriptional regulator [Baekduia sp.]
MEAATQRSLSGEKAQRIVDAMRASVALRGVAGSTFDHVAREAGVSRGLLHYYFGSKERLLAEVVKRDTDLRMAALDEQLATASSAADFIEMLRRTLDQMLREDTEFLTLSFEAFTLSRRNPDIAAEFSELVRRTREHVAGVLAAKQDEGVLELRADPEAIAEILFGLGDGLALRILAEPERDHRETVHAGTLAVAALIG